MSVAETECIPRFSVNSRPIRPSISQRFHPTSATRQRRIWLRSRPVRPPALRPGRRAGCWRVRDHPGPATILGGRVLTDRNAGGNDNDVLLFDSLSPPEERADMSCRQLRCFGSCGRAGIHSRQCGLEGRRALRPKPRATKVSLSRRSRPASYDATWICGQFVMRSTSRAASSRPASSCAISSRTSSSVPADS